MDIPAELCPGDGSCPIVLELMRKIEASRRELADLERALRDHVEGAEVK